MASIRSLGFSIFSTYDGGGVTRARNDINSLSRDIDRNRTALVQQAITLRALSKISLSALTTSALAVTPALVPIAQAAGAAAGAFTAMGVSAGSALGIYGAAMRGAITNTLTARDSIKTLRDELAKKKQELAGLTPGTAAYNAKLKEITATQRQLNEAMKSLSPTQRSFIKSVDDMTGAWNRLIASTQDKTLSVATDVIQGMTAAIPKLKSVIDAVHPSIKQVSEALKNWLSGAGFERFIGVVKNEGVPALQSLLNAGRHVLTFLGEGFRAFAPEGTKLAESIERGAAALAKWSQGGGFTRFIDKVQQNSPQIREFFRALGDALRNVGVAMEGLGMPALTLATVLLKIVAAMPPSWLQAIFVGWMAVRTVMLGMAIVNGVALAFNALGKAVAFAKLASHAFMMTTVGIRVGLIAMAAGAKLAAAATMILNGAFLASPITWVILAIAALIAAIVLIATKTTWFQTAWKYTWNFIKEVASTVWEGLKTAWQAVVNFFKTVWDAVGGPLTTAWNAVWNFLKGTANGIWLSLQQIWQAFCAAIIAIWNVIGPPLTAAWNAVWTAMQAVGSAIWTAMQAVWNAFVNAIIAIWNVIGPVLSAAWNVIWTGIQTVASVIWAGLQAAWQIFINAIIAIWNVVGPVLSAAWNVIWTAISTVATTIWNALTTLWNAFANGGILGVWNVVSAALTTAWNAVWNAISTAAQAVWNALQTAWNAVVNAIVTAWNAVGAALSAAWNAVWNAISTAAQAVWNALQTAWNAFLNFVQNLWNTVSAAISAAWNAFWNLLQQVATTVWNALQAAWSAFWTFMTNLWNTVRTAISTAWTAFWTLIRTVAQTIWTAIQTAWQAFWTFITNVWNTFRTAISTAWSAFWNMIKDVAKAIWDWIGDQWNKLFLWFREVWNDASAWIKEKWEDTWNAVKNLAKDIWNDIADLIGRAINGIIGIINDLINGFNKITDKLDLEITIGTIGKVKIPKFADGGMVTFAYGGISGGPSGNDLTNGGTLSGYAPGRDTIPAMLSKGEGVLTPEAVRGLGGPGFVNGANKTFAGHRGAGAGSKWQGVKYDTGRDDPDMFAKGGMVGGRVPFAVGGMTADALRRAGVSLGMVSQGEYSNGKLSAGTHSGGGVVDISSTSPAVVARLRAAGFAAWARTGPAWAGNEHIHAVLMNHPSLSGPARAQVGSFMAGGTGLGVGGGGGGGGGIDLAAMFEGQVGKILRNMYKGLNPLQGIGGAIAAFFGGGSDTRGAEIEPNEKKSPFKTKRAEELYNKNINGKLTDAEMKYLKENMDAGAIAGNTADLFVTHQPAVGTTRPRIPGGPVTASGGSGENGMMDLLGPIILSLLTRSYIAEGIADAIKPIDGFKKAGVFGDMLRGMGQKLTKKGVPDYLMREQAKAPDISSFFGGGGVMGDPKAVQNWAGLAAQALARAGLPAGQLNRFLALMAAESGGNPGAVNLWDSNARMGQASRGLMQVIPSTFAAYRDKSLPNNIMDPLANMTASARYIKARYGGSVPGSPYANGTDNATPGAHLVGEEGPELVTAPGYAMFGGGESVLTAAQTASVMAPPAAPASMAAPSAPSGGGMGGGGGIEDIQALLEAAERMREVVMQAWSEAITSGKNGQGQLAAVHQALVAEMGQDVPGAYNIMRAASAMTWTAMNAQTTASWAVMRDGVYAEAQLMQNTTMPLSNQAMSLANTAAWTEMGVNSTTQWGLMRDTTFTEANDFIAVKMPTWADEMDQAVSQSFQFMNEATAESWSGMQDATKAPVNWIITNAYNNGLARLWNEVAEVIFEDGAKTLPTVATLAKGGPVNGPGTSTSDSIPARLSKGEHVWTAKEVRAAGGHRAVQAMRANILGHAVRGAHRGAGFAKGGWNPGSDSMSGSMGLPGLGELKRGFMMDEAEPFLDALDSGARASLATSNFKQMGAIADALSPSDWMRQYIEKDDELNKIGSGGPPWIDGVSNQITSWGGVTVNQRTADMLNMALQLGASFSATQGSFSTGVAASAGTHDGGGVVDLVPANNANVAALRAVGFAAWNRGAAWGSPSFSPHIHAVALGDPTVSPGAAAQVMSYLAGGNGLAGNGPDNFTGGIPSVDGVQAIGGGGREVDPADLEQRVVAFDKGGWIMPGQFAYNGTGRPELATPADDIANLANAVEGGGLGGDCLHLEFNFNGPVSNEQDVRKAIDEAIPKLRRAVQAGTGKRVGG